MVVFSQRYFPLVLVVNWDGWLATDTDIYLEQFGALAARGQPWVVLNEARWAKLPDAAGRKQLAEMSDRVTEITHGLSKATAAVLGSRLAVGAAMAVSWLTQSKLQIDYFGTSVAATTRLQEVALRGGLAWPGEANALAQQLDALHGRGPTWDQVLALT
jgi:hypothetical protein